MEKDWKKFGSYALSGFKRSFMSIGLVPIFFFILSPRISGTLYWIEFWMSLRIGTEIALFYGLALTGIYGVLYSVNPGYFLKITKSLRFKIALGLVLMVVALNAANLVEPHFTGVNLGLQGIMVGALLGGLCFVLITFYLAYQETREHNLELRTQNAESTLHVLKNQMQPHFLFNSLNSLSELIETNPGEASTTAQKLSDLYREILESSRQPMSHVRDEVLILEKYLELEQLRFGDRLKFSIRVPDASERIAIPSLLLQTLVENCIKHGIAPSPCGGFVRIDIAPEDGGYAVSICNSGEPFQGSSASNQRGTGIENSRARLELSYPQRNRFSIGTVEGETRVEFWISGSADNR